MSKILSSIPAQLILLTLLYAERPLTRKEIIGVTDIPYVSFTVAKRGLLKEKVIQTQKVANREMNLMLVKSRFRNMEDKQTMMAAIQALKSRANMIDYFMISEVKP